MFSTIEPLKFTLTVEVTIGDVKDRAAQRKRFKNKRNAKRTIINSSNDNDKTKIKTRHVKWKPGSDYKMLRNGRYYENETKTFQEAITEEELIQRFEKQELQESMITHFCHVDKYVCRTDKTRPKYVAVFKCKHADGQLYYIRTQHKYLKQMYRKANRRDSTKAWDIEVDGTPYWTDRYADRVINEQQSKRNYTKRQREEKLSVEKKGVKKKIKTK